MLDWLCPSAIFFARADGAISKRRFEHDTLICFGKGTSSVAEVSGMSSSGSLSDIHRSSDESSTNSRVLSFFFWLVFLSSSIRLATCSIQRASSFKMKTLLCDYRVVRPGEWRQSSDWPRKRSKRSIVRSSGRFRRIVIHSCRSVRPSLCLAQRKTMRGLRQLVRSPVQSDLVDQPEWFA